MSKIIGVDKIQKRLGFSESTIMNYIFNEGLPAKKEHGQWVVDSGELEKWLNREAETKDQKTKVAKAKGPTETNVSNVKTEKGKDKGQK